jgi:peptide deformylase
MAKKIAQQEKHDENEPVVKKPLKKAVSRVAASRVASATNVSNASKLSDLANCIVKEGHPALRTKADDVPVADITSKDIKALIQKMKDVLATQSDGIGLAAPQIGISKSIFIVSKKVFGSKDDVAFINPVIIKESKEKKLMEGEGCLSVRWMYGKVKRSTKVTLRFYNERGELAERGAGGLLAHIFQHEVDHLNGILFIDKAIDIERIEPTKPASKNSKAK